jgi:hypothetical protein
MLFQHLRFVVLLFLPLGWVFADQADSFEGARSLKILHLSFHRGCINEIEAIGKELSLDITHWFLLDKPPGFLDGKTSGAAIYNVGHERAADIWKKHQEFFDSFDVILTSDTAPLARIFLQNGWKKPLLIWICNRFDYYDAASLDCDFPDKEYYQLFRKATKMPNVVMIGYTAFEHHYASCKGVDTGGYTITPCGAFIQEKRESGLPEGLNKAETFFLPPYHNEMIFMNLSKRCDLLGVPAYCGRYNGPMDLVGFKGIIHLPNAWSNFHFFENMELGIPYFIPSKSFLKVLKAMGNYFQSPAARWEDCLSNYAEWYSPAHESIITYFDSWEDLKIKIESADFEALSEASKAHARENKQIMLGRWREVFMHCSRMLNRH